MRRKGIALISTVLLCAFSTVPCETRAFAEPIRLGVALSPHLALIHVADRHGFFKTHGVDVVMKVYETGPPMAKDLTADKIDIATTSEFVFVLQTFTDPSLRILATTWAGSDVDIIVRSGISRPQDLKGKRIAVTRGSAGEFFLYNYFLFNRIPTGSAQVVYQTLAEMVKTINDGTIDAAVVWSPFTTRIEKQMGTKVATWPAQSGQDYYLSILSKEAFLKNQPKTVEQFVAALSDAELFIAKYPEQAQAYLQQWVGLDATSMRQIWSKSRFQLQLTQDLLVLMELEAKWAIRNNLVKHKEMPNYLDFFYFDALDKVKPEAVSIVH